MFDPSGGDHKPEDQLVTGGEKIERPSDPKRDGYTFEGWYYTDENGKEQKWDFNDSLNQGIELKAKWTKERRPSDPKRDGYTFEGWYYTDENGKEQKWDFNDSLNQGIELKAKWTKERETSKSTEQTKDPKKEPPASDKKQASKKKPSKKKSDKKTETLPEWGQYQIKGNGSGAGNQNGELSETSDIKKPFVILILLIASGSISAGLLFRNYNRRK